MYYLESHYQEDLRRDLETKVLKGHQLKIQSIHLHISFREQAFQTQTFLLPAVTVLEALSFQKSRVHLSKKASSHQRLQKGKVSGISTTLRGRKIYGFLANLQNRLLPSLKTFEKIPLTSLDSQGNLHWRISKAFAFPEVEEEYEHFHSRIPSTASWQEKDFLPLDISLNTTARNPHEGRLLLTAFQLPFF